MKTKCDIEVVTGFIGSGKTLFINGLVQYTLVKNEKVVIISCEKGNSNISEDILNNKNIVFYQCNNDEVKREYIKQIIQKHNPNRIIIEYNGTRLLDNMLSIIYSNELKKLCKITTIFFTIDAKTFDMYINNMGNFLIPFIKFSNLIVITNTKGVTHLECINIEEKLRKINNYAHIITINNMNNIIRDLEKYDLLDTGLLKQIRIHLKNFISRI
ncbi:GTP-binding protein [Clostridium massiliodielmoense]|uniref:GTP-binding protein n=1 Tax=Clostridium massiliodielmoense TaxID=1776385 RepID=UPI000A26D50C|nr:GTP-binding protein [Clostridium massiliodielmoense]